MDNLEIRELKLTDLPAVLEIERESFPCPWSQLTFLKELNNSLALYLVGLVEDEIVAYIGSWLLETQIHITTLATKFAYRNEGFATQILRELLERARELEIPKASLEVRISNQGAQQLYKKENFIYISKKRSYYKDNGEDALVMWKRISD